MGGDDPIAANKVLMRHITDEIWNHGKLDLIDALIAHDFVDHVRIEGIEALEEALRHHGTPEMFNTDQGAQFTSPEFTGVLKREGVTISMDGKGRATDNVFIERVGRSSTRTSTCTTTPHSPTRTPASASGSVSTTCGDRTSRSTTGRRWRCTAVCTYSKRRRHERDVRGRLRSASPRFGVRPVRQRPRHATSIDDQTLNTQLNTLSRDAKVGGLKMVRTMGSTSLNVRVVGSRVAVSLDGVRLLDANLPFPLPRGQAGIWAMGPADITFSEFTVSPEKPTLFVVMQFSNPFNELYSDVVVPVGTDVGFSVVRADEMYGPGIIIADIERHILEAKAIVADITPNNPNVYWEVGYAHALRKPTVLIAERETPLPFDVSPFRTLFYDNTIAGKARIQEGLRRHLAAIQTEWSAG